MTYEIKPYNKTGEFQGIVDFTKKKVDYNIIHGLIYSGCHCIWVESDLESYVKVYGMEKECVQSVLNNFYEYLKYLED